MFVDRSWGNSQVVKTWDCKSYTIGSNPIFSFAEQRSSYLVWLITRKSLVQIQPHAIVSDVIKCTVTLPEQGFILSRLCLLSLLQNWYITHYSVDKLVKSPDFESGIWRFDSSHCSIGRDSPNSRGTPNWGGKVWVRILLSTF